ncbi:hypothetical protein JVU11DRAFT_4029 [Chiua virens]|nr:hypothetical protein JVU11DRAFT_4029 [Chiua virens]
MSSQPAPPPPGSDNNYLTIFLLAGLICIAVSLGLLWFLRYRVNKRRAEAQGAPHFLVKGIIGPMAEVNPSAKSSPPPFDRSALTASIIMPKKSITKPTSRSLSDKAPVLPRFERSPPPSPVAYQRSSSIPSSPTLRPHSTSLLNPACPRLSRCSSTSGFSAYAQPPPSPGYDSRPPSISSFSPSRPRRVHQIFEPTLPDELSVSRRGEYVTVLQSFDDGWCLIGRDASPSSRISNISAWIATNNDHVDVGLVPAWVFIKSHKGITFTPPIRNTSVNALHLGQSPAVTRDAIVTWSNFL